MLKTIDLDRYVERRRAARVKLADRPRVMVRLVSGLAVAGCAVDVCAEGVRVELTHGTAALGLAVGAPLTIEWHGGARPWTGGDAAACELRWVRGGAMGLRVRSS